MNLKKNNIFNNNNKMTDINGVKILKKRGRKPKNKINNNLIIKEEKIESEEEVIIAYLPLNINEIEDLNEKNDIFIKSEKSQITKINDSITENLKETITIESDIYNSNGIYINKINLHNININKDTKCWWCKNSFDTPHITLPEQYFDGTFYCIGNFCSYNCVKAYNIDLNDNNIWRRESLINLMYYMTFNHYKNIEPSPSWLILKDFGGFIDIHEYRKNFDTNSVEYLLLQPPLISRQMQIEESYKKNSNTGPINKIDKLFYQENSYSLKRSKPIETSHLNLEKTMGLKRKNK
jgi:hypothetical protein